MYKIALIGGPSGGKTTIAEKLKEDLKKDNYVYFIPETATELLKNVVESTKTNRIDFQRSVLNRQLFKEDEIDSVRKYFDPNMEEVMVCDRGLIDNRAYLSSDEEFFRILKERDVNWLEKLDSYDLVIYLASSSTLDNLDYGNESNTTRYENRDKAKSLDMDTLSAWLGHRNLVVIPAKENFQDKIDEAISVVRDNITNGRKKKDRLDISDYTTYYYENKYPKITQEINYLKNVTNGISYAFVKRTGSGYTNYLRTKEYQSDDGITVRDTNITKELYDEVLQKYPPIKTVKEDITSFYEDGILYNIIETDDKVYLESSGDLSVLPKHLLEYKKVYMDIGDDVFKSMHYHTIC